MKDGFLIGFGTRKIPVSVQCLEQRVRNGKSSWQIVLGGFWSESDGCRLGVNVSPLESNDLRLPKTGLSGSSVKKASCRTAESVGCYEKSEGTSSSATG